MPSEHTHPSKYAQGKHAFTAPVRGLAVSCVTINTDPQIAEGLRCSGYELIADDDRLTHAA
jgi:hypothetical protein